MSKGSSKLGRNIIRFINRIVREVESLRQNIEWGHGANFDRYHKWGKTISGSLCEMALSKIMKSYFSHSVNNFYGKDNNHK